MSGGYEIKKRIRYWNVELLGNIINNPFAKPVIPAPASGIPGQATAGIQKYRVFLFVIPAKAGIQEFRTLLHVIPAKAGIQEFALKEFYVYILSSKRNGTIYTGVTSNLAKRVFEHKNDFAEGFTKTHGVHSLVWYERHESADSAINREKQIKKWNREWKMRLIDEFNPFWDDLYEKII